MPNFIIIEQSQYQRMPWKNGLGETLEIQRHDDESGLRFRISQAAVVEDGVFSDFSGLHRTLVLLSGEGMTLEHKSETGCQINKLDSPLDIARFSGGDTTYATLKNGKIEDLNIMVRDDDTGAQINVFSAPQEILLEMQDNDLATVFYANEPCQIILNNAQTLTLERNSSLIVKQNIELCLTKGSGIYIKVIPKNN